MNSLCVYDPVPAIVRRLNASKVQGVVTIVYDTDGSPVVRFLTMPRRAGGEIDLAEFGRLFMAAVAAL